MFLAGFVCGFIATFVASLATGLIVAGFFKVAEHNVSE